MNTSDQPLQDQISSTRFHGLDAARAIALLIGILHHGIESFVTYANGDWITQDSQSSLFLDIVFYVSHVFRMQAFFLMSGFFAHMIFHRNGLKAFALNRMKRLVIPFIVFWPLLYFSLYNLWIWGIQYNQGLSYAAAVAKLPSYMIWSHGFPLMHLWFLYFLILFCAGVVVFRSPIVSWIDPSCRIRHAVDRLISFFMNRWWGSLAFGLAMVGPMLGMTDWFGVDTSASGLIPRAASFIIYGLYFTLGWFLHRQSFLMEGMKKFRVVNLCMSIVITFSVIIISLLFSEPADPADGRFILMGINTLYAFASMTMVFAFIGFMLSWFEDPSPTIRYMADSAYWGYLIHLPIIAFLEIIVATSDIVWPLKLLIIIVPAAVLLWFTYQYGVRNTWIGILLNGKRKG
ncbi:MAG: acyltransferase family protein [Cyclobacteriaceae bacterium]|nr:acyltransferase family protein [Cyclobacteriaceae bacterium]